MITEQTIDRIRRGETVTLLAPPPDLINETLADEVLQVLGEAGTEIHNAYGQGNPVAARIRALRDRIQNARLSDRQ